LQPERTISISTARLLFRFSWNLATTPFLLARLRLAWNFWRQAEAVDLAQEMQAGQWFDAEAEAEGAEVIFPRLCP
jgi:hypothetical protein